MSEIIQFDPVSYVLKERSHKNGDFACCHRNLMSCPVTTKNFDSAQGAIDYLKMTFGQNCEIEWYEPDDTDGHGTYFELTALVNRFNDAADDEELAAWENDEINLYAVDLCFTLSVIQLTELPGDVFENLEL